MIKDVQYVLIFQRFYLVYKGFAKFWTWKDLSRILFKKISQRYFNFLQKSIPWWHAYCIVNKFLNAITIISSDFCNRSLQNMFWIDAIFILYTESGKDFTWDLMGTQYIVKFKVNVSAFKIISKSIYCIWSRCIRFSSKL